MGTFLLYIFTWVSCSATFSVIFSKSILNLKVSGYPLNVVSGVFGNFEKFYFQRRILVYFNRVLNTPLTKLDSFCYFGKRKFLAQSSHLQMFCKVGVSKNFAKFTGKRLCWSLFFIVLQPSSLHIFKNTFFIEHLRVTASNS